MPSQLSKPVIALIGGIGSGKSFVARQFAGLGCAVIDADALSKQVLHEATTIARIKEWWGPGLISADGKPDRAAIARIVFAQAAELARLEGVIHPRVNELRHALRATYDADPAILAIIEDCPLLLEKGLDAGVDAIVFVQASDEARRRRVADARGWSAEEHALREKKQLALDTKARRADYVVENNGDEAHSLAHVRHVLSQILHQWFGTSSPRAG